MIMKPKIQKLEVDTIYLDGDGVIANFNKALDDLGIDHQNITKRDWEKIESKKEKFWTSMSPMPDYKELVKECTKLCHTEILTGRSTSEYSIKGKHIFYKSLPYVKDLKLNVCWTNSKPKFIADPTKGKVSILIDDNPDNIQRWKEHGGIGILFKNVKQALRKLNLIFKEK